MGTRVCTCMGCVGGVGAHVNPYITDDDENFINEDG